MVESPSPPPSPSCRSAAADSAADAVPEESSLWEKLELYEPPKKLSSARGNPQGGKVEVVFEEGPIAPVFCPRKAPSPTLIGNTLD